MRYDVHNDSHRGWNPHWHIYIMHQNFKTCVCTWEKARRSDQNGCDFEGPGDNPPPGFDQKPAGKLGETGWFKMQSELFGFDIRLRKKDYLEFYFTDEIRTIHLLRPEIHVPLSIDPLLWPSLLCKANSYIGLDHFNLEDEANLEDEKLSCLHHRHLWSDLKKLDDFLKKHRISEESYIKIAFSLISLRLGNPNYYWRPPLLTEKLPRELIPESWVFLGYDIADDGLISGLMNCGYKKDEKRNFQKKWTNRLNDFGLISDVSYAIKFKEITDKRIPEHAPFYVFGLYCEPYNLRRLNE